MAQKLVLAIFLASAIAFNYAHCSSDVLGAQVITIQNTTGFARANPGATFLRAVARDPQPRPAFDYELGKRENGKNKSPLR